MVLYQEGIQNFEYFSRKLENSVVWKRAVSYVAKVPEFFNPKSETNFADTEYGNMYVLC